MPRSWGPKKQLHIFSEMYSEREYTCKILVMCIMQALLPPISISFGKLVPLIVNYLQEKSISFCALPCTIISLNSQYALSIL